MHELPESMATRFGEEPLFEFMPVLIAAFLASVQNANRSLKNTDQARQRVAVLVL